MLQRVAVEGAIYQVMAPVIDRREASPAADELVDVGGPRLHMNSGGGYISTLGWMRFQPEISHDPDTPHTGGVNDVYDANHLLGGWFG